MQFKVIDNHTLEEMARVGSFDDCEVCIFGGEGNIPHFHILNTKTREKCCVRIDCAEYFNHNDKYKLRLNSHDKKDLDNWLNSCSDDFAVLDIHLTVFRNIVMLWNQNNPDNKIDIHIEKPDYTKLK